MLDGETHRWAGALTGASATSRIGRPRPGAGAAGLVEPTRRGDRESAVVDRAVDAQTGVRAARRGAPGEPGGGREATAGPRVQPPGERQDRRGRRGRRAPRHRRPVLLHQRPGDRVRARRGSRTGGTDPCRYTACPRPDRVPQHENQAQHPPRLRIPKHSSPRPPMLNPGGHTPTLPGRKLPANTASEPKKR